MPARVVHEDGPLIPNQRGGRPVGAVRVLVAAGLFLVGPVLAAAPPASAASFSNTTPIVLSRPGPPPGCPDRCPSDRAAPYPSAIAVSGQSGTVTDVNVTLRDLTYELNGPPDADIMLVAPGGRSVMLMSDACGDNDNYYPATSPITLSFDEQAGATLPADAACTSGTFRPVDDDNDGEFMFHEPDEFPGGPAPANSVQLSSLNGISPNGAWNLYVVDDYPNDPDPNGKAGQIGGGWSIDISTSAAAAPVTTVATTSPTTARPATTVAAPVTSAAPVLAPPPGSEVSLPPVTSTTLPVEPAQPGDFVPLAADTEDGSDNTVLFAVMILLVAGALGIMAMFRPGGWRFWRR